MKLIKILEKSVLLGLLLTLDSMDSIKLIDLLYFHVNTYLLFVF